MPVEVRGPSVEAISLLPVYGCWGLNSVCQAWQQAPLPTHCVLLPAHASLSFIYLRVANHSMTLPALSSLAFTTCLISNMCTFWFMCENIKHTGWVTLQFECWFKVDTVCSHEPTSCMALPCFCVVIGRAFQPSVSCRSFLLWSSGEMGSIKDWSPWGWQCIQSVSCFYHRSLLSNDGEPLSGPSER